MKTVLITGAAGFIGSHLAERLLNEGHVVIGVDNFVTGSKGNVERLGELGMGEFEFFEMNVIDGGVIEKFSNMNIDEIYHLACPASPKDFKNLGVEILEVCALGGKNILEIAKRTGAKFLYTSTSEVYGDPLEHPQCENYFGNVNTLGPRSCYDEGKRFLESYIMNFSEKHGVDFRIARVFNTYGPHMRKDDGRVIPNFIEQFLNGESVTIYGNGTQTRSFCYVGDLVDGLIKLMGHDGFGDSARDRVFNIGNPHEITINELAETLAKVMDKDLNVEYKELPKDDPLQRCPDISRAKEMLGFEPKITLEEGLRWTCEMW
jgi:nucleoside-diphosphate-sugar epimerase